MAFKTFAPGVLTSSDVNTFLMRQAVITCTSSTRPASPSEGMTIYETDTDLYQTYTGSAWVELSQFIAPDYQSYTPTWTDLTVGNAPTNVGYYTVIGRTVHLRVRLIFGSTTSLTGSVGPSCSYPPGFSFGGSNSLPHMGVAKLQDNSAGNGYFGTVNLLSGGMLVQSINTASTYGIGSQVISSIPFSWNTGDEIRFSLTYGLG